MLLAGEPNEQVKKVFYSKAARSFYEIDGRQRLSALKEQMRPVALNGEDRHMIYPGNDPKVMRIVKKIIRGLSHHHGLQSVLEDDQIWADVRKFPLDENLPDLGVSGHCDPDIFCYWYELQTDDEEVASIWRLWFYQKREFVAMVLRKPESSNRIRIATPA